MESSKLPIVFAFAIAVAGCGKVHAPQPTEDHSIFAQYSAVQAANNGDVETADYSLNVDGSDYIPGSDVVMSVKFCPRNSPFICAHGDFYNFAVPRHDLTAGEKWQFAGRAYTVVPGYLPHSIFEQPVHSNDIDRTFTMLNSKITVNVISTVTNTKDKTCVQLFLYSRAHGVLGDLGRCDGLEKHFSWNYWLVGSDGFGSPIFEKAITPKATMTQAEAAALYNQ